VRFFQALMPREDKFFDQFNAHARTLVDGAVALRDLLEGGPGVSEACARIVAHENAADTIAREVLLGVRRSFITPFDRGDIKELIGQLDDAIDQMQTPSTRCRRPPRPSPCSKWISSRFTCARWPILSCAAPS
jgi:uncharacterized protein Yka (UPF0111/DUF47 family)